MTSRELWQSIMDKTEEEIRTGKYKIRFSRFEAVYEFPKPPLLIIIKRNLVAFILLNLKWLYEKTMGVTHKISALWK